MNRQEMIASLKSIGCTPLDWYEFMWQHQTIRVGVKRDDLAGPLMGGNKFRKLKYHPVFNNQKAGLTILSMGGGYSNLLLSVAALSRLCGHRTVFATTHKGPDTYLMQWCQKLGSDFIPASRSEFRRWRKHPEMPDELSLKYQNSSWIPEGGGGEWSRPGLAELIMELKSQLSSTDQCELLIGAGTGISAACLYEFLPEYWSMFVHPAVASPVFSEYLEGQLSRIAQKPGKYIINVLPGDRGIGSAEDDLIHFLCDFFHQTGLLLDPFYNGKALYGWIRSGRWQNSNGILIHSGGVQAWIGLAQKNPQNPLVKTLSMKARKLYEKGLESILDL